MRRLIAGGYAEGDAAGLYPFDVADGRFAIDPLIAGIRNVSAGLRVAAYRWIFVDEAAGEIVVVDLGDGVREIARRGAGGSGPCGLAVDRDRSLLAVANYDGGTTALFRLDRAGTPVGAPSIHRHGGSGPVRDRQGRPHAHWVGFAGDGALYVADLGADRVLSFAIDGASTLGAPGIAYAAPPGTGPRQMAFHPDRPVAYLVGELAATLTVLRIDDAGRLVAEAIHSTLPDGVEIETLGGAIALDAGAGRLYVSNRGHDSVATFAIAADGSVERIACIASGGRSPRFLLIDGGGLLVAHEQAGGVTLLPLDDDRAPGAVVARADIPCAAFLAVVR